MLIHGISVFQSILFISATILWIYWLWSRRFLYKFAWNYPGVFGLPLIGVGWNVRSLPDILPFAEKMLKKVNTNSAMFWLGTHPFIYTLDPEQIGKILSSSKLLNKSKLIYEPVYDFFQGGLIASPAIEWHKNRKAINPSFNLKVLLAFFPIFHKAKCTLVSKLNALANDGKCHDLGPLFQRLTMTITVETTMGKKMDEGDQVNEDIIKNFRHVIRAVVVQIIMSTMHLGQLFFLVDRKFKKSVYEIHNFVKVLIDKKLKTSETILENNNNIEKSEENSKTEENIFINRAIKLYEQNEFTLRDIVCEANSIVAAAFETSANSLFSTIVMLAMHPDVQERLYQEVCSVFPDKSFEMDYSHFKEIPYLDMVINEVLRLLPPVYLIARHVVEDTRISDALVLPKDLQIIISIYSLHRRKDIWGENADKFDPDHFLPENLADKHPYSYIPFSKGPRNCIGWRYALFAVKVLVAGLVRNFRFETDFKFEDLHMVANITLQYKEEPKLRIYKRQ